jgi:Fe-S cluster assembly protein SufB
MVSGMKNKVINTGISEKIVREISKIKQEPKWMTDFRVQSYKSFDSFSNPKFGPELSIDFDTIHYYKRLTDKVENSWDDIPKDIKDEFDKIMIV